MAFLWFTDRNLPARSQIMVDDKFLTVLRPDDVVVYRAALMPSEVEKRLKLENDELRAQKAQVETAGWALLDAMDRYGEIGEDAAVVAEFRAVLDGNATPTDDPTTEE